MAKQINNEVIALLGEYNRSIAPRQLILVEEANANPALNAKCMSNWHLITSWILARWGSEETPCTFQRVQQAVSALHKGGAGLQWMDGKAPGMARQTEKSKEYTSNSQGDIIARGEEEKRRKVADTVLTNAKALCSNYDCKPHSLRNDRRKKLLEVFQNLSEMPGTTAEQVAKGMTAAINEMEKVAATGPRIRGI